MLRSLVGSEMCIRDSNKPYAQSATATLGQKPIKIINAHLASPAIAVENKEKFFSLYYQNYKVRSKQLKELNKFSESQSDKISCQFMVGDLNTLKFEPIFKRLKYKWVNTNNQRDLGYRGNFPNSSKAPSFLTLDYILAKGKAKHLNTKVIRKGSSDHYPIIATFEI